MFSDIYDGDCDFNSEDYEDCISMKNDLNGNGMIWNENMKNDMWNSSNQGVFAMEIKKACKTALQSLHSKTNNIASLIGSMYFHKDMISHSLSNP